ncbi:hypothetical protein PQX77_016945 [Marasmius sp. AFHP31]|nr:hypothetical protein PQX77_016945 [Marasmius sp. AFHP31]
MLSTSFAKELAYPGKTRKYFNQAVEVIKFCLDVEKNLKGNILDEKSVARIEELFSMAKAALRKAVLESTKATEKSTEANRESINPFTAFEKIVAESSLIHDSLVHCFKKHKQQWKAAKEKDKTKMRILKTVIAKLERAITRPKLTVWVSALTRVDRNTTIKVSNSAPHLIAENVNDMTSWPVICLQGDALYGILWLLDYIAEEFRDPIWNYHFYVLRRLRNFLLRPGDEAVTPLALTDSIENNNSLFAMGHPSKVPLHHVGPNKSGYTGMWHLQCPDDRPQRIKFLLKEVGTGNLALLTSVKIRSDSNMSMSAEDLWSKLWTEIRDLRETDTSVNGWQLTHANQPVNTHTTSDDPSSRTSSTTILQTASAHNVSVPEAEVSGSTSSHDMDQRSREIDSQSKPRFHPPGEGGDLMYLPPTPQPQEPLEGSRRSVSHVQRRWDIPDADQHTIVSDVVYPQPSILILRYRPAPPRPRGFIQLAAKRRNPGWRNLALSVDALLRRLHQSVS